MSQDPAELVARLHADGAAAWPALAVDRQRFAAHLAAILAVVPAEDRADLRAADLYLAVACLDGAAAALAILEREHLAPVRATLLRSGHDADLVDDAIQTLRYRLLVATPARNAKLETYRGRGSLTGWLRVVALRQARALLGPRRDRSDSLDGLATSARDLELAVLGRTHADRVRRLTRDAVAALDDRGRAVLRLEVVDGVPHGRIAELYGVHRTTVLRWIEEARQAIARAVRAGLCAELDLGDSTAQSLLRSLAGRVELSMTSALCVGG